MNHTLLKEINDYVETNITLFHKKRLDSIKTKINLDLLLIQKNPYLYRAKNILTAQDLIKSFLDAFLQSQEETLFGEFIEGLAIYVCSKVSAIINQLTYDFTQRFCLNGKIDWSKLLKFNSGRE
ncbi:MAG: PmeII family type II restriction endonuclease [Leptospiraceae bacterium]|nr:PmeII family type II restriction endonuclease [Leptospiraceae bacterium]